MAAVEMPDDIRARIGRLQQDRDMVRVEITHREITGKSTSAWRNLTDDQLATEEAWYVAKINELVEPYENQPED